MDRAATDENRVLFFTLLRCQRATDPEISFIRRFARSGRARSKVGLVRDSSSSIVAGPPGVLIFMKLRIFSCQSRSPWMAFFGTILGVELCFRIADWVLREKSVLNNCSTRLCVIWIPIFARVGFDNDSM